MFFSSETIDKTQNISGFSLKTRRCSVFKKKRENIETERKQKLFATSWFSHDIVQTPQQKPGEKEEKSFAKEVEEQIA